MRQKQQQYLKPMKTARNLQTQKKRKEKKEKIQKCQSNKQAACTNGFYKTSKTPILPNKKNKNLVLTPKYRYRKSTTGLST